jgi:replicative DNA helicase
MKRVIPKPNHNPNPDGRIPPQAVDLEEAVIGAVLLDYEAIDQVIDILPIDAFYKPAHKIIWQACAELHARKENIDLLSLAQQLMHMEKIENIGGAHALSVMTNRVVTAASIQQHARIVLEKYMARELIRVCSIALADAYEDKADVFDLITSSELMLNRIVEARTHKDARLVGHIAVDVLREMRLKAEARRNGIDIGIKTGFPEIDATTGGLHPGDLTIIAARPGMGKTAFAISLARNVAVDSLKPVAFFSLEVTSAQIIKRFIASQSRINLSLLRDARLTELEFQKIESLNELINSNIFIDDTGGINILELRAKCRRLRNKHKIELVIVDYLQLMQGERDRNSNREQEIGTISRGLKAMAKELEIPVIALSQLSRGVESRGDKRPQLSDLRESGSIEQDADNVAFLFRPEYYGISSDASGNSTEGVVEFDIRKQRHGETNTIMLKFFPQYNLFETHNQNSYF